METIKNLLKPGGSNDNEQLYDAGTDPNKGKVAGEGAHFSHQHSDSGVGGVTSTTSANNPASGLTGSSATKTAEPSSSNIPIGTATTTGEREFPLSNTGIGSTSDPQSQAGVAGQDFSNVNRAAETAPIASSTTVTSSALPTTSSAHQASTVGITGTTGTVQEGTAPASQISSDRAQKIYSPAQPADDKCTDTLHGGSHVTRIAPMIDPCYDQNTAGQTSSSSVGNNTTAPSAGVVGAGQSSSTSHGHSSAVPAAAAAGTGTGLAGASAAGERQSAGQTNVTGVNDRDARQSANAASTVPTSATSGIAGTTAGTTAAVVHPYSEKTVDPRIDNPNSANANKYHTLDPKADGQRAEPVNKEQEHHYARDAAAGGAVGAGAGALAGHEFSKKDAEKQVKEAEKEHKQAAKEAEKEQKQAEKEQKQAEKEAEKEQKHAAKEAEKEQKQAEKEAEKEQKQAEKAEKPGLIDRLLHRGDSKKEKHADEPQAVGATSDDHHRNKLHKDPPTKGYASQVTGGTGTTALATGNQTIPSDATVPGTRYGSGHDEHTHTSQPEHHLNDPSYGVKRDSVTAAGGTIQSTTPYAPAPQSGYASQVTGGTGTTQLAQGNRDPLTNPTKSDPLNDGEHGPMGYASTVTGGTGTTKLAQGTTTTLPTDQMVPGRSGSVAGVTTETPFVEGPKAGTGKYAEGVTGGTGTTMLAQGQLDEVANPRKKSVAEKVEEALVMK